MAKILPLSPIDFPIVAESYAAIWHRGQTYGEGSYKDCHLAAVVQSLIDFGHGDDHEMLAAGWMHDGPEDSPSDQVREVRMALIYAEFSQRVGNIVFSVTGVGKNRRARNACAYGRLRLFPQHGGPILKGHDRLINARSSRGSSLHDMYRKEYAGFRRVIEPFVSRDLLTALDEAHEL